MLLLRFLFWRLAVVRNSRNSRFGAFNSRLGRFKFPVRVATVIRSQGLDLAQRFCCRAAVQSGKSTKFPAQREKPGISSVAAGRLVEAVEPHRTTGHDLMRDLGRGSGEPIPDHLRGAGEKAIAMRIVGGPQDLVRPDILGEHLDAALDWLERDPAIALEEFAGPGLEAGIIEALVVEMTVHAVEPRGDPAAAGFEEPDSQFRVTLAYSAPNHAHTGEHHLHRMRNDVLRAAAFEAVDADRRHAAVAALVDADREVELLCRVP